MRRLRFVASILTLCSICVAATAEEKALTVDEIFDAPLSDLWSKQFGNWKVADGVLQASQQEADGHICAFRYRHLLQDADIQIDFKAAGGRVFHVGFDPAPGELNKKGHLFAAILTEKKLSIQLNRDKSDEKSTNEELAAAEVDLVTGKTYSLLLHLKGDQVEVEFKPVEGRDAVKVTARHPTFHVKKPGLVFRVGGQDDQEIHIDRVRLWER